MNCYRHPNEEVFLRCGKCDRPICTRCTRHGPAGARCVECSSMNASPLFQVSGDKMLLGGAAGFGAAFFMGYLLALGSGFGFFLLWGALLAGGAVGEVVLRTTGRKRGTKMEILTGVCTLGGVLVSAAIWFVRVVQPTLPPGVGIEAAFQGNIFYLVAMGIMVFSAVSRVRFL